MGLRTTVRVFLINGGRPRRKVEHTFLNVTLHHVFLDISPNNILLSPTDLKSLISQLRAETQTSLHPSELSVGNLFGGDGFVFPDPTPVFRLSSTDNRGQFAFEPAFFLFSLCNKVQKIIDDQITWVVKHCKVLKHYLAPIVERIPICGPLDVL